MGSEGSEVEKQKDNNDSSLMSSLKLYICTAAAERWPRAQILWLHRRDTHGFNHVTIERWFERWENDLEIRRAVRHKASALQMKQVWLKCRRTWMDLSVCANGVAGWCVALHPSDMKFYNGGAKADS